MNTSTSRARERRKTANRGKEEEGGGRRRRRDERGPRGVKGVYTRERDIEAYMRRGGWGRGRGEGQ